jgi:Protein of unknown function (DUF551)
VNEWISVKDRLPDRDWDNYFIIYDGQYHAVTIGWYDGSKFLTTACGSDNIRQVHASHWMPLPQPPKEKE